jgi:hypothetical protein
MIKTITKHLKNSKKNKSKINEPGPKESTIFALLNFSKSLVVIQSQQIGKIAQVYN